MKGTRQPVGAGPVLGHLFSLFWQSLSLRGPGCLSVPFTFNLALPVYVQLLHTLCSCPASQDLVPLTGKNQHSSRSASGKGRLQCSLSRASGRVMATELCFYSWLPDHPNSLLVVMGTLGFEQRGRLFLNLCCIPGWLDTILQKSVSSKVEHGMLLAGSQRVACLPLSWRCGLSQL